MKSLRLRKKVIPRKYSAIYDFFRDLLMKCCTNLKYSDRDWYYIKARKRLNKELDIENFIRGLRLSRNLMKHLTTKVERRLIAMQSEHNVLHINDLDK